MSGIMELMAVALSALLAENFVLVSCMGIGTRIRAFREPADALRTGGALTVVMVLSTLLAWLIDRNLLLHYGLTHYRVLVFSLLVPALVWALQNFLRLFIPELYRRHKEHLGAVTTNAAALGCALLMTQRSYGLGSALIFAFFGGLGTMIVLGNFAYLLGEAELEQCPKCFRGVPIRMITAGLMAMSLVGFYGLHIHY